MKPGSPETSTPNAAEFLRMPTGAPDTRPDHATRVAPLTTRDPHDLEVLVRLIVRDELQRRVIRSSGVSGDEDASGGAPAVGTADTANDNDPDTEVMSAEDVAAFLGVDRNTVYDYAGRGTIPCRRLGKRLLFHRPTLVSWLDPCKAASTRKV